MAVYQNPVGLSGAPVANQLSEMVTFKERLCKPFCVLNSSQPNATVSYTVGTPTLNGETVFVPITARIEILVPAKNNKCCGKADPLVYTENFTVAFQGRTTLPTTTPVVTSVGMTQSLACVKNRGAHCYVINDSIVVSIGAAPSAS